MKMSSGAKVIPFRETLKERIGDLMVQRVRLKEMTMENKVEHPSTEKLEFHWDMGYRLMDVEDELNRLKKIYIAERIREEK